MFKDYDKYLSTSIKVYLFVLVIILILKLVGLDYFGVDVNNRIILKLSLFIKSKKIINNLFYFIPLIFNHYIVLTYTCNENSKKIKIYNIMLLPIFYILQCYKLTLFGNFSMFAEMLYFCVITTIYNKLNKKKYSLKRFIKIILIILALQVVTTITRYNYSIEYVSNPIANLILNLDYMLFIIIIYKLNFMKGDNKKWTDGYQEAQFLSSLKKLNLKNLLTKLRKNWRNFKKQDKVTKLTYIIYFIFSLIWNTLSVIIILFVARLNDTFIECIFILTSFWLSKRTFGKAFHLSSMSKCFIISNLSYYILNRITTPLGISIIVPILLGVGLSYVTSKLVKTNYKPLYRGMPEDLFEETIIKVVDKNSTKYKICYDFYIKNKSIISLAIKYNYTESGIRKIKDRVNDKIKRLN